MNEDGVHVALHDEPESVVRDAVTTARSAIDAEAAFAAVAHPDQRFHMEVREGVYDPRWSEVRVGTGIGLGGRVLSSGGPMAVDDYPADPRITSDFKPIVASEGLHGIACVPVYGPDGVAVLLYVSQRTAGAPGDTAVDKLERIARYASVGLHHIAARARERELAVLRERQVLASELHDSVAQSLFAIGVAAQQSREAGAPAVIEEKLREIEATATHARSELRSALARISRAPDAVAFEALFEAELRLFERRTGRRVWITRHGEPRDLGRPSEQLLIDSVREGLTNAAKHASSQVVLAHLAYQDGCVLLSLQSEVGPSRAPRADRRGELALAPGSGLSMLRDRTERFGGALELAIDDGVAVLRVEVPA